MATYDISVHCKDCGKVHPVLLRIDLDGRSGLVQTETVKVRKQISEQGTIFLFCGSARQMLKSLEIFSRLGFFPTQGSEDHRICGDLELAYPLRHPYLFRLESERRTK